MADIHTLPTAAQSPVVNAPRRGALPAGVVALKVSTRKRQPGRRAMDLTHSEVNYLALIRKVALIPGAAARVAEAIALTAAGSHEPARPGTISTDLTPAERQFVECLRVCRPTMN